MTAPLAGLMGTSVVSEMMRPRPEPRVAAFLDSIPDDGLGLVSITIWEVLDGIGRLPPGRRRRGLSERFGDLLHELFEDRIVEWTLRAGLPEASAHVPAVVRKPVSGRPAG